MQWSHKLGGKKGAHNHDDRDSATANGANVSVRSPFAPATAAGVVGPKNHWCTVWSDLGDEGYE